MKLLVDENLPLSFGALLRGSGFDAAHVGEVGLIETDDALIVDFAGKNGFVIITFDLDFSRIVVLGGLTLPSVITFRMDVMTSGKFLDYMTGLIPKIGNALKEGCMVTVTDRQVRIRKLPV